jgi:hypothetical protein
MYKQSIEKIRAEINGLDKIFGFAKIRILTPPPTSFDLGGFIYERENFSYY